MVDRNEHIDELIAKYLSGNAMPEEAIELDEWMAQSDDNRNYFLSCEKVFAANGSKLQPNAIDQAWKNVSSKTVNYDLPQKGFTRSKWLRIAAVVALLIGVSFVFRYLALNVSVKYDTDYVAKEKSRSIGLTDGSKVNLMSGSEMHVESDFGSNNRTVVLRGKAEFDVQHKGIHPFIVDAKGCFIKDIGTKFIVETHPGKDSIYIEVTQGLVLVYDNKGNERLVKVNQKVVYIKSTGKIVEESNDENVPKVIMFNGTTLDKVAERLSELYKVEIQLSNKKLAKCTLTSSFTNENIETVLSVICETLGITYKKITNGYVLMGENC